MALAIDKCSKCGQIRELYPRPDGAICFGCVEETIYDSYTPRKSVKELRELLKIKDE